VAAAEAENATSMVAAEEAAAAREVARAALGMPTGSAPAGRSEANGVDLLSGGPTHVCVMGGGSVNMHSI
jgi:hypothetical protein